MLTNCLAACTHLSLTVSQLFEPQVQISPFSRTTAHIFVSPGDAPANITQCIAWMERQFNACQTPCSIYLSIFNSFRVIRCLSQCVSPKIAIYTTLLFPLGTPLWQSRKTLHKRKDNSVLAKPIAACTHLCSTVSQLFEPRVQKNRRFHVPQLTFLFPLETPLRLSCNTFHEWKDNSMLAKSIEACTYLSSIVSELYDA